MIGRKRRSAQPADVATTPAPGDRPRRRAAAAGRGLVVAGQNVVRWAVGRLRGAGAPPAAGSTGAPPRVWPTRNTYLLAAPDDTQRPVALIWRATAGVVALARVERGVPAGSGWLWAEEVGGLRLLERRDGWVLLGCGDVRGWTPAENVSERA